MKNLTYRHCTPRCGRHSAKQAATKKRSVPENTVQKCCVNELEISVLEFCCGDCLDHHLISTPIDEHVLTEASAVTDGGSAGLPAFEPLSDRSMISTEHCRRRRGCHRCCCWRFRSSGVGAACLFDPGLCAPASRGIKASACTTGQRLHNA